MSKECYFGQNEDLNCKNFILSYLEFSYISGLFIQNRFVVHLVVVLNWNLVRKNHITDNHRDVICYLFLGGQVKSLHWVCFSMELFN